MENFIDKLKEIQTMEESIDNSELEKLSIKLIEEYECEKELENNLLLFFSLNSTDLELLLKKIRRKSILEYDEDKNGGDFLKNNEKLISGMIKKMNKVSQKESNMPFHLSAALGKLKISERTANSFKIDIKDLFKEDNNKMLNKSMCPIGSYPRYVGKQFPWKLKMSFRTRTMQRVEDVGCHFQHGPFKGTIRGWFSYSPQLILMVLLQGWGFKLAANNQYFFYKSWFVFAVGLSPWSCQHLLFARKY